MYYLSIISPFHNSARKCQRLLSTFLDIEDKGVELILVDDGSTDDTLEVLEEFRDKATVNVTILSQDNKGPGGARNTGLNVANGKYVWFVDSDDDINLNALFEVKEHSKHNYDFIDFNYITNGIPENTMSFNSGIHNINDITRKVLLAQFGRIWTKVFNKDFLTKNSIQYPEYCIYEDNPFIFIYPFITKKFMKSETIAYFYNTDLPSVTRNKPNPRYFDRLYTSVYGFNKGKEFANRSEEISLIENKFIGLFLINTVAGLSSIKPSRNWLATHKVMKQYRILQKELNLNSTYTNKLNEKGTKFKIYFLFHWYLSYLTFGDQSIFFEKQRIKAWNRPFTNSKIMKGLK